MRRAWLALLVPLAAPLLALPLAATLLALPLAATLLALPLAATAQSWVPRQVAQLQALDKVTARVTLVQARIGTPAMFGTLTINLRACNARPPDEVPDAAAWLEISDSRAAAGTGPAFRGWMFANAPAVNTLEHPVYDIRVLECR